MTCPYCDFGGSRMEVHAHLGGEHGEAVEMGHREGPNDPYFRIVCPFCDEESVQSVNPGGRDPGFLDEFGDTVRLVAFDLLLYHLQAEHPERVGLAAAAKRADGDGPGRESNDHGEDINGIGTRL